MRTPTSDGPPGWLIAPWNHLIDGWAQGWVIPAGMQGTIDLTFEPQQTFRSCLTVGGLAAVVLLVPRCGFVEVT